MNPSATHAGHDRPPVELDAGIHVLDAGPDLLLLLRPATGAWVMVPRSHEPFARLLSLPASEVPVTARAEVEDLRRQLRETQLARPEAPSADELNTLILKLTTGCNYACSYCYDFEPLRSAATMPVDLAIRATRQAITIAPKQLHLILHGGEPTLVFDLVKAIVLDAESEAARQGKVLYVSGQTNGSRFDAEVVGFSIAHRIHWGLSLDGPAAINDTLRTRHDGSGTYAQFEQGLAAFPDFVRACGVKTTVTSKNARGLVDIARHFHAIGMSTWDWSLYQSIGRARERDSLTPSTSDLIEAWNGLFACVLAGEFDGFPIRPVLNYVDSFLAGTLPRKNMCMRRGCGAARDLLSITASGQIDACDCIDPLGPLARLGVMSGGSTSIGSAKLVKLGRKHRVNEEVDLKAARDSATAHTIRSRDVTKLACGSCSWLSQCGGTCLAHAGDISQIWDTECELALNAFPKVATSVGVSSRLREYRESCRRT